MKLCQDFCCFNFLAVIVVGHTDPVRLPYVAAVVVTSGKMLVLEPLLFLLIGFWSEEPFGLDSTSSFNARSGSILSSRGMYLGVKSSLPSGKSAMSFRILYQLCS